MKVFLDMLVKAPLGQGLFCENFSDSSENPPPGSDLLITEDLLFNFLTEDGVANLITE
jgi:hypothetical protein